jgi:hypothetical protein
MVNPLIMIRSVLTMVILASCFLSTICNAQLVNCNTFLKSNYLEVGVNWNGAYGSSATPPAGFHPDTLSHFYNCAGALSTDTALGFVADVDKDGWNAGSPRYYGDYILPGAHQEGWSLMADGVQINEWNMLAGDSSQLEGGMTIYDTSYRTGPSGDTSVWEGAYDDHLFIYQMTVLDTQQLFFTVYVSITNTSTSPSNNVYYMRTIKSENDALLPGGSYNQKSKINYTLPDSLNRCVVSSTSTVYPEAYIALGTENINGSCFLIKNAAAPAYNTIDNIAAGSDPNYLYNANDSLTGAGGMGIIFNLGTLISFGEADFSFVYAFTPGALNQALGLPGDSTVTHVGISNTVKPGYILYPNPARNMFSISGLSITDKVFISDVMGRDVSSYLRAAVKDSFGISDLSTGVYIITVKDTAGLVKWRTQLQKL